MGLLTKSASGHLLLICDSTDPNIRVGGSGGHPIRKVAAIVLSSIIQYNATHTVVVWTQQESLLSSPNVLHGVVDPDETAPDQDIFVWSLERTEARNTRHKPCACSKLELTNAFLYSSIDVVTSWWWAKKTCSASSRTNTMQGGNRNTSDGRNAPKVISMPIPSRMASNSEEGNIRLCIHVETHHGTQHTQRPNASWNWQTFFIFSVIDVLTSWVHGSTRASITGWHLTAVNSVQKKKEANRGEDSGAWVGEMACLEHC